MPFTGSHEAMISFDQAPIPGDIVCDVRPIITDVLNSFTEVTMSSSVNQSSAVGIFLQNMASWNISAFIDSEATAENLRQPVFDEEGNRVFRDTYVYVIPPDTYAESYQPIIMNSLGEGGVNVVGEGGDIAVGDLIVTSSTPGKGMKQADDIVRSYTVAKAREAVTFSSPTEEKMIACIYMCG